MVVATSVLATLVVGFVAGYFCSRHFRPETAYTNMPPLHAHTLNRLDFIFKRRIITTVALLLAYSYILFFF